MGFVVLEVVLVTAMLIVPVLVVPVKMAVLDVLVTMAVLEVLLVPAVIILPVLVVPVKMAVLVVPVKMAVLDVLVMTGSSCLRTSIVTTTATMAPAATNHNDKSPIITNFPHLTNQPASALFSPLPRFPSWL